MRCTPDEPRRVVRHAEAVTGNPDSQAPSGEGTVATAMRDSMVAIRMDFAEANQWVFYGMAVALGIGFLCALRHPGTRVTEETRKPRRVPANRHGGLPGR